MKIWKFEIIRVLLSPQNTQSPSFFFDKPQSPSFLGKYGCPLSSWLHTIDLTPLSLSTFKKIDVAHGAIPSTTLRPPIGHNHRLISTRSSVNRLISISTFFLLGNISLYHHLLTACKLILFPLRIIILIGLGSKGLLLPILILFVPFELAG